MSYKKTKKASVALTTVIVITAILTVGAVTLVLNTIDINKTSRNLSDYSVSYLKSITCLEEGILRIKQDNNYTGVFDVRFDGIDICSATVTNPGGSIRNIKVVSTNLDTNFVRNYEINISTDPYSVLRE